MLRVISSVCDAVLVKALLPNFPVVSQLSLCPKRKSSFDELHGLLQGNKGSWSQDEMNVVGHETNSWISYLFLNSVLMEYVEQ